MIHPIPAGTRDVLPDEMRELRAIGERLRATFEEAGYGEVSTPLLEYEEVLQAGDDGAANAAYRMVDDQGLYQLFLMDPNDVKVELNYSNAEATENAIVPELTASQLTR